jgi:uncharacterized protein (TIGR00661 family)
VRILYGVVGEGMGHATRSVVVSHHLLNQGHELRMVVSGQAHDYLKTKLKSHECVTIEEIHGLILRYFGNRLRRGESLYRNLIDAPKGIRKNIKVYRKVAEDGFNPQLVISDFESWAALYGLNHRLPVLSIDNMQIINRCRHSKAITKGFDFRLARGAVKMKVPGAYHYLISSFFFPPVRRKRTTLVPPILRPEIIEAKREPGDHVLVYSRAVSSTKLSSILKKLPYSFLVYGHQDGVSEGNITYRAFSETGFLDDLRTARAVLAGGGFSLMSEAVSLHVPMLSIPIAHQFEQELNAQYLEQLGYGVHCRSLETGVVERFLEKTDKFAQALAGYKRRDNSVAFACVDEIIDRVSKNKKRSKRLKTPAMGTWTNDG